MPFNDHQKRLWQAMIDSIHDYRAGNLLLSQLIGYLEGSLDAGSYESAQIVAQWYDYWTPLEILFATKGDATNVEETLQYLDCMERYLYDVLIKNT